MSIESDESPLADFSDESSTAPVKAWSPEQMVRCEECLRANPPTRPTCLYCGFKLPITEATAPLRRPHLRPLEQGELGHNVVLVDSPSRDDAARRDDERVRQAADLLRLEEGQLRTLLDARRPLPLARVPAADEAELMRGQLATLGLRTQIVSDEELAVDSRPPKRVRALELTERSVTGWIFAEAEELRAWWDEIILIVVGRAVVRQVEVEERKARGPEKKLLDTRETDADEVLLDLYTARADGGWRIAAHSFDFSCLGADKELIAAQNVVKLTELVRERAPGATFDDGYYRLRSALAPIWPTEQRTEARGYRRARTGGFITGAATISNNVAQFTAYSRLSHHFERRKRNAGED